MDMKPIRHPHRLPLLLLVLPILFFYSAILLGMGVVSGGDFLNQFVPWRQFALQRISDGAFPGWNPFVFCGTPLFANIQNALYYPFNLLHTMFPLERVFSFSLVVHHVLAAVGMYWFIYSLYRSSSAAVMGALVYAWSGFLITHAHDGHFIHVRAYAWIPFVLWAQNGLKHAFNWKPALGMAASLAGMFYGGHTQIPLYIFYLVMFRSLWWGWLRFRESQPVKMVLLPVVNTLLVLLVSILISLPVLLPLYQLSKHTAGRAGGAEYSFAVSDSMPPGHIVTLAAPFFYGDPTAKEREAQFWETRTGFHEICGYTGIIPIVLFLFSWKRLSDKNGQDNFAQTETRFFGVLACFGLLFAMGGYNPLYPLLYYGLPGWSFFRVPGRLLLLWIIGISVCSAAGWQLWCSQSFPVFREKYAFKTAVVFSILIIVMTGVLYLSQDSVMRALRAFEVNRTLEVYNLPESSRLNVSIGLPEVLFETRMAWMMRSSLVASALILAGWGCLCAAARWKASFNWLPLALVILFDLLFFAHRFVETRPRDEWHETFFPRTELVEFLQDHSKGYRILCLDDAIGHPGLEHHPELRPNRLMYYGIETARGYDPLILQRYARWVNRMYGKPDDAPQGGLLFFPQIHPRQIPQLNVMNVKHVVTTQALPEPFALVWSDETSGMKVYENPECLERVFLTEAVEGDSVEIISQSAGMMEVNVNSVTDNILVYSQVLYPGWRVEVDGVEQEVKPYLDTFVSVEVPAGEHTVRFVFTPRFF